MNFSFSIDSPKIGNTVREEEYNRPYFSQWGYSAHSAAVGV